MHIMGRRRKTLVRLCVCLAWAEASCETSFNSSDWVVAKHTLALRPREAAPVFEFVKTYLCEPKTPRLSDLGCENWRAWCVVRAPYASTEFGGHAFELHWVEAPSLNDLKRSDGRSALDGWIQGWEGSDSFSAFSHNKVQLFTTDLDAWVSPLLADGVRLTQGRKRVMFSHLARELRDLRVYSSQLRVSTHSFGREIISR